MSIGLLWRCDPIIMVGQDLAFDRGGLPPRWNRRRTTVTLDLRQTRGPSAASATTSPTLSDII